MAPELRTQGMSAASDMWALGCVGVCLLTGQTMEYRWKYGFVLGDRKSTRLNSSHLVISYAVFCLKKKKSCSCVVRVQGDKHTGPYDRGHIPLIGTNSATSIHTSCSCSLLSLG